MMHVHPDVIAISDGYHGCHEVRRRCCCWHAILNSRVQTIALYNRIRGNHCSGKPKCRVIRLEEEYPKDGKTKVLCWTESPLNPTGEIVDLAYCRSLRTFATAELTLHAARR